MTTQTTIDQLKDAWENARKSADSLGSDFRTVEALRQVEAEAHRRYLAAKRLQAV